MTREKSKRKLTGRKKMVIKFVIGRGVVKSRKRSDQRVRGTEDGSKSGVKDVHHLAGI